MSALAYGPPGFPARIGIAVALVAAADFLLYDQPAALSLLVLAALIGGTVLAIHPTAFNDRMLLPKLALLVAGLAPLAENVSMLSVCVALVCLSAFALTTAGRLGLGRFDGGFSDAALPRAGGMLLTFLAIAPFRLVRDFFRWRRTARRLGKRRVPFAAIAVWIMPLFLAAVFLVLFGEANPVIEYWLSLIDLLKLLDMIQVFRIIFWIFVLVVVWAFLRPRLPKFLRRKPRPVLPLAGQPAREPSAQDLAAKNIEAVLFGKPAILRSLIVFNLMFAVQTVLDAAYLWGGVALPDGMSYASYAHRGAYPLIVTALIAAGFVLAALRPGSATSGDVLIRRLVYLWVAQNIALVISSILRLDLYIGIYALTYWRIAAFVWMGLVAAGLALIIARIALGKSNKWLLTANLLTLSATLYACCYVNFAGLIADYNVDHSLEMSGQGTSLDVWYLRDLGPAAFPAIDRYLAGRDVVLDPVLSELFSSRTLAEEWFRHDHENWRAWSFRDWRLMQYLDGRKRIGSSE